MSVKHPITALSCALSFLLVASPLLANEEGEELFQEYCASCHGEDAEGVQNYTGDFDNFTARLNGETENMSDFTDFFEDEEIVALYEYLLTLKQ